VANTGKNPARGESKSLPLPHGDHVMDPTLSRSQCALLQYLRDHSAGRGQRTSLDPKHVIRALRVGRPGFDADMASLAALGFAGARRYQADLDRAATAGSSNGGAAAVMAPPSAVWITGKGEEFLRLRQAERRRAPGAEAR
jgi:hypothetical protein